MNTFHLLVALFALLQCFRYARRALLFVAPSVAVEGAPGDAPGSAARLRLGDELAALGFVHLGAMRERGALGAWSAEQDVYAGPSRGAFADVGDRLEGPGVVFFTPFPDGAVVLTSNSRRRSISTSTVQAGGLPGASLEAVLAAHEVAVERSAARHGKPTVAASLEARVASARSWFAGEGRREIRRVYASSFGIVVVGLVLLATSLSSLLRAR